MDRYWNILQMNAGVSRFLALFPSCNSVTPGDAIRLVFHPQGLRPFIENWLDVTARLIQRVHCDVLANTTDEKMRSFLDELLGYAGLPARWRLLDFHGTAAPFLTIDYLWNGSTLRLFSTITMFSTAQDIESFFPADETTRAALTPA